MIEPKLAKLKARGVILSVIGQRLSVDAPAGALSADDYAELRNNRDAIIAALRRPFGVSAEGSVADWPAQFGAAADFVILLTLADLDILAPRTEILKFSQGVEIVDRQKFLNWLKSDIRRGPSGHRAGGAIQADVNRLRSMLLRAANAAAGGAEALTDHPPATAARPTAATRRPVPTVPATMAPISPTAIPIAGRALAGVSSLF